MPVRVRKPFMQDFHGRDGACGKAAILTQSHRDAEIRCFTIPLPYDGQNLTGALRAPEQPIACDRILVAEFSRHRCQGAAHVGRHAAPCGACGVRGTSNPNL